MSVTYQTAVPAAIGDPQTLPAGVLSPITNRGVGHAYAPVTFMPHHYGLTIIPHGRTVDDGTIVDEVKRIITPVLTGNGNAIDQEWFKPRTSRHGYRHCWIGPAGARIAFDPVTLTLNGRRHFQLELAGKCCDQISLPAQRWTMRVLASAYTLRCNRIDLAFDSTMLTAATVWDACRRRDLRVHFPISMDNPNPKANSIRREISEGIDGSMWTTIYLGRRSSERMARAYDSRGYLRFELELKSGRAERCFDQLILGPDADAVLPVRCMGVVRDFADFVDRRSSVQVKNCRLLDWWAAFTSAVPIVRQPAPMDNTDASSTREWLINTISPTLATVANGEPDPERFVLDLYHEGNRRQNERAQRNAGRRIAEHQSQR